MTIRRFADRDFTMVGAIEPERSYDGRIVEFMPQVRYSKAATTPLNAAGKGPFCRFRVARQWPYAGLYILTSDGLPMYVGECANLSARWGPSQYGAISPKNCYTGGQSTNCRVNNAILLEAVKGASLALWFIALNGSTGERRSAETELIQVVRPPWNRAKTR